jgi:hypothetical protein
MLVEIPDVGFGSVFKPFNTKIEVLVQIEKGTFLR